MARYWVGGTGNTNDTAHWSATSGGAGGASVPSASDDVIFDTLSNGTAYTVTVNAAFTCLSLTFDNPLIGVVTLAGSSTMAVSGSIRYASGMTASYSGTITFNSTTTGRTITTNGVSIASPYTFNGSGGGWTLQDALTTSKTITLTAGTFDTGNQTVTQTGSGLMSSTGGGTRTLTLGSSTWTMGTGAWNVSGSGMTLNAGTSSITNASSSWIPGSFTYNNVTLTSASQMTIGNGTATYTNFTRTGGAGYSGMTLSSSFTVTGTFTVSGNNSGTQRAFICSNTIGTVRTITCNGTVSLTNVDFQDITGVGSASWTGTSVGNAGGNSGITFTTPTTRYWVHGASASYELIGGGMWSTSSGGSVGASDPLPQDDCVFDANSFSAGSKTVAVNTGWRVGSITWTGATNTPAFNLGGSALKICGSLTLISGMTLTGSAAPNFWGRSSHTLTTAGLTLPPITFNMPSGAYTLQDSLTAGILTLSYGTLNLNNFDVSIPSFSTNNSSTRALTMGSGTITLTGSGTVWDATISTGLTITPNSSTIKLTEASSLAKIIEGGGKTYNNLWLTGAGTGIFIIRGSNTWNDFRCDTPPHIIEIAPSTNQTLSNFIVSGTAGNLMTIRSQGDAASTHSFSKTGGGVVNCDYLSVKYSTPIPATLTWYAGLNSTDGGNNSGWIFTNPPPGIPEFQKSGFFLTF